jgi:hypothetical protein
MLLIGTLIDLYSLVVFCGCRHVLVAGRSAQSGGDDAASCD